MILALVISFFCFFLSLISVSAEMSNCISTEPKNKHLKLKCSRINSIEEINFKKIPNIPSFIQLDLSNNSIRELPENAFPLMQNLTKLNLDKNDIAVINEGAFSNLSNLKKLILSNNKLKNVHKNMFTGLLSVDQLRLNQNMLSILSNDTFDFLPSLKSLDVSGNPLICNCDLWWLRNARFKLNPSPKCDSSLSLHNQLLNKTKPLEFECNKDNKPIYFSIKISPDQDQIVFEGDPLTLICSIRGIGLYETADELLSWSWEGNNVSNIFDNAIQFRSLHEDESEIFESVLIISDLYENHTGEWSCNSLSPKFDHNVSIRIRVLSKESTFCEVSTTENDKGRYSWPETIAGHIVELPCEITLEHGINVPEVVSYFCSVNGSWLNLNTDRCPYMSQITRILQQFSRMNLTNHKESLLESAARLRNFTVDNFVHITQVKDVHFIVTTIENYMNFLENGPELAFYLIQIINEIVKLPKSLLERVQQEHVACSRLIEALEMITKCSTELEFQSNEFAIREISVSPNTFAGLTCSRIRYEDNFTLNCSTIEKTLTNGMVLEASIHVPTKLFYHMGTKLIKLVISSFKDNRLLPDRNNNKESSMVIGANIVGEKLYKLDEPIVVILKNGHYLREPMLLWWNTDTGLWTQDSCQFVSNARGPYLKFDCYRFGYFSLAWKQYDDIFILEGKNLIFTFLHPSIYVGTFICVTCLMLAFATYCFCYTRIQMSKKMKHSLANTWLSASLLFLIFNVEIHQTEHQVPCQIIGLSIHYFALATLFWMTVTIKALYKRVHKSNPTVSTPSEDIPTDEPIEKRILGIYLVGWGISAILCGIAGAVNMRSFTSINYCFLTPGPALSTVLIPASLVLFYLLIMCLLVKCAAKGAVSNPQLSVGTQAIDLELLDGVGGTGGHNSYMHERCNSVRSITTFSSQAEDTEHSPVQQLKAFVIFLVFYLLAMVCAAACVMTPLQWLPYGEKVFSFLYATICILLGAFVLFFHCFARNDVRSAWNCLLAGKKAHRKSFHAIANSFTPITQIHNQSATLTRAVVDGPAQFDASSALVVNGGVKSLAPADEMNRSDFLKQTPNINLLRLHRQHYRGCSTLMADGNFYNPHQSIVAKKFFRKQRTKRNNSLQIRKCRSGGSSPVSTLLLDGNMTMKIPAAYKRSEAAECEEKMQFLMRPQVAYDELSSEKHPLTYDEPDITGCEEAKTGTESEATFTVPEYAEIEEQILVDAAGTKLRISSSPTSRVMVKEQMCGTSEHDWCSCDAISDVNSEPTYNYAYIRNGYASSRSSSGNSHLYTSVVPDLVNSSVDRLSKTRPKPQLPCNRSKSKSRQNYKYLATNAPNEYNNGDFGRRRKEEVHKQLPKDLGLSPSSDFSSGDKVETCV